MIHSNTLNKYWRTMAIVATQSLHDGQWGFVANFVLRLLRVAILLSLWQTVFANRESVAGMTLSAVLTYTLIAEVFSGQLSSRTGLDESLWRGDIANRMLRPIGIYGQFIAEMIGAWIPNLLLFSLPLFLIAPYLGIHPLPATPSTTLYFVISLTLGVAVGTALDVIFAGCMVFLEQNVYALMQIRDAITILLSGALIPLALFPYHIGDILNYLPFAALASAPLRIYTGTGDPLFLIALQCFWAMILWPLAHALWRINRERLVSHGG